MSVCYKICYFTESCDLRILHNVSSCCKIPVNLLAVINSAKEFDLHSRFGSVVLVEFLFLKVGNFIPLQKKKKKKNNNNISSK